MKKLVISVLVMIAILATMNSAMAYTYEKPVKSSKLPRTTPLEKGIDPSYLYDMLDQLEQAVIAGRWQFTQQGLGHFIVGDNGI